MCVIPGLSAKKKKEGAIEGGLCFCFLYLFCCLALIFETHRCASTEKCMPDLRFSSALTQKRISCQICGTSFLCWMSVEPSLLFSLFARIVLGESGFDFVADCGRWRRNSRSGHPTPTALSSLSVVMSCCHAHIGNSAGNENRVW